MTLLVGLVVLLVLANVGLGWRLFAAEERQQRRDAEVVATVAQPRAEAVLMLYGGPHDGGRIVVSLGVWQRMCKGSPVLTVDGRYAIESVVSMPDGGGVISYRWVDEREAAA